MDKAELAAKEWQAMLKNKKEPVTSFYELNLALQKQVERYVEKYTPNKISIWGSYSTGMYHEEGEGTEFIKHKKKFCEFYGRPWKESSDLDLIDCSFEGKRIEGILEIHGNNLHTEHVIYNNGKYY